MNTGLKIKEFVKTWMDGHEPDTFPKNEHGVSIFSNGATSLNIKLFFEDLLTEFTDDNYSQLLKQRDEMRLFLIDIKNDYANGLIEDIEDVAIRAENILNSFESTNP